MSLLVLLLSVLTSVFLVAHVPAPAALTLPHCHNKHEGSLSPIESSDAITDDCPVSLLQLQVAAHSGDDSSRLRASAAQLATVSVHNPIGDVLGVGSAVKDIADTVTDNSTNPLEKVAGVAGDVADTARRTIRIANTATAIVNEVSALTMDPPLGGQKREYINFVVVLLIGVVAVVLLAVYFFEQWYPEIYDNSKNRPALWVLMLLLVSYALLIPSLTQVLFSFKVSLNILGLKILLTSVDDHPQPITESTLSVIGLLNKTGSTIGAVLVCLYAIVIPALKLILLAFGEYMRGSSNPAHIQRSRQCIIFVQYISKWACPDLFAYMLLLYLLRHLPEKTDLIDAPCKLDIGFSCFSLFCVLSTFSSLFIQPPKEPPGDPSVRSAAFKSLGRNAVSGIAVILLAIFAVLLGYGLTKPCMRLDITGDMLIQPNGPLPASFGPIIKSIDIGKLINAEVPVWDCILKMWDYAWNLGEANCFMALIGLAVFAVGFSCLDMLILALASLQLANGGDVRALRLMRLAKVIGKISMLDVMCMGVIVVCFAAGMYKSMGVAFSLEYGIWLLIGAEVVHYITYWIVAGAVEHAEEEAELSTRAS